MRRSIASTVVAGALILALGVTVDTFAADAPGVAASGTPAELTRQVMDTERAFAKTMADRDLAAFSTFVSSEAVFMSGKTPLRGKSAVVGRWKALYEKPQAPFSWEPEQVQVLDSGGLALSTGPVRDATGKTVGTFTSIWRREADGEWRIIFDSGCEVCARCASASP
jgi:ketosteroid isomerase-like protein